MEVARYLTKVGIHPRVRMDNSPRIKCTRILSNNNLCRALRDLHRRTMPASRDEVEGPDQIANGEFLPIIFFCMRLALRLSRGPRRLLHSYLVRTGIFRWWFPVRV